MKKNMCAIIICLFFLVGSGCCSHVKDCDCANTVFFDDENNVLHFHARIVSIDPLLEVNSNYYVGHFDGQYLLRLHITDKLDYLGGYFKATDVSFSIHSPVKLFAVADWRELRNADFVFRYDIQRQLLAVDIQ